MIDLLTLHMVDGRQVQINPDQITRLVHPREGEDNKQITDKVKCIVMFVDGGFVSVAETCETVRAAIGEAK